MTLGDDESHSGRTNTVAHISKRIMDRQDLISGVEGYLVVPTVIQSARVHTYPDRSFRCLDSRSKSANLEMDEAFRLVTRNVTQPAGRECIHSLNVPVYLYF